MDQFVWSFLVTAAIILFLSATNMILTASFNRRRSSSKLSSAVIPLGNLGILPFIGETIHFISCAYSDKPETFMNKRHLMKPDGDEAKLKINSKLIFMDDKGTMIYGLLFTNKIQQFQDQLMTNHSYLIFNPIVKYINKSFPNVNPKFELILQRSTRIEESPPHLSTNKLNFNFKQFAEIKNNTWNDEDVIRILKKVKQLVCCYILINLMLDTITLNLWDNLACNEGQLLETIESENLVIAFCNMKAQFYQGISQLQSSATMGMLQNPFCDESENLISWMETNENRQNLNQKCMAKMISNSKKNLCYWIEENICKIENKSSPCYEACQNCLRAVTKTTDGDNCIHYVNIKIKIISR